VSQPDLLRAIVAATRKTTEMRRASAPQAVLDAIAAAETLLANDPAVIGALKGNNALRKEFVAAAGTLGSYNEGLIGPGHCED
jgi:hypothetical protein